MRIEVDSEMLAEGMRITFFGISAVFASMGLPDEAVRALGIRGDRQEPQKRNEQPRANQASAEKKPGPGITADQRTESPRITLDEIIRVIKRKVQDEPDNNGKIKAILNNEFHKEKVQELPDDSYETFLKEIRNL